MSELTDGKLPIVTRVHAVRHNRDFVVAQSRQCYVVEGVNKDGHRSKQQPDELWSYTFDSVHDAVLAIQTWDKQ